MDYMFWAVLVVLSGLGLLVGGFFLCRYAMGEYAKSKQKATGCLMAKELRNQLHANDTQLYKSVKITHGPDRIHEHSRWFRPPRFRVRFLIECSAGVDNVRLEEVVTNFVKEYLRKKENRSLLVRTSIIPQR